MKKFLSLSFIGSLLFTSTAFAADTAFSQKPFTDVSASSSFFEGIEYLRSNNVVKGYLDGTYRPKTRINRAEFIQFAINPFILDTNEMGSCVATNVPASATTVFFSDVAKDSWYATDVCFGKMKQLINGYPDGSFRPGDYINFVEAAKIISNVFSLHIKNQDVSDTWYIPYVKSLSDLHAIPLSIKRFDQTMTRGEMAEIVFRLKANRTDKASTTFSAIQ